jgi:glycosyltransferase involved in cell wall biosynthesis
MTASQELPLVSIGMPTFNGARFIRQSLDALLAQDYDNFELIISDNGSTDATPRICQEYAGRDGRIVYLRNEINQGTIWNFKNVLDWSRGQYFMWAGDHDLWHSGWLSRCVAVLKDDPGVAIAYGQTMLIDEEGRELGETGDRIDTRGMGVIERYRYLLWTLGWGNMVYGVHRSQWLKEDGLYLDEWWSDAYLLSALALRGTFAQLDEVLFFRRKNRADETPEEIECRHAYQADPANGAAKLKAQRERRLSDLREAHRRRLRQVGLPFYERLRAELVTLEYFERTAGLRAPLSARLALSLSPAVTRPVKKLLGK